MTDSNDSNKKKGNGLIGLGVVIMLFSAFFFYQAYQYSTQPEVADFAGKFRLLGFVQIALGVVSIVCGVVKNNKS